MKVAFSLQLDNKVLAFEFGCPILNLDKRRLLYRKVLSRRKNGIKERILTKKSCKQLNNHYFITFLLLSSQKSQSLVHGL